MYIVVLVLYFVGVTVVLTALTIRDQALFNPGRPIKLQLRSLVIDTVVSLFWPLWLVMSLYYKLTE